MLIYAQLPIDYVLEILWLLVMNNVHNESANNIAAATKTFAIRYDASLGHMIKFNMLCGLIFLPTMTPCSIYVHFY